MLAELKRLWAHSIWADGELLRALGAAPEVPPAALREMSHVIAVEEVWLSRLEGRSFRIPVWPTLTLAELGELAATVRAEFTRYLDSRTDADLATSVHYKNTAGQPFSNTVFDIVMQVGTHGQYHRGKVNLLLRQSGLEPAPVDYIAFARGVPAATQPPSRAPAS